MFNNIGITEMLLIAAVALIILGPDKFPGTAKVALRFMRDIRTYWDDAKRDITEELKPFKKELKELEKIEPEQFIDSLTGEGQSDGQSDTSVPANYGGPYPYGDDNKETSSSETAASSETSSDAATSEDSADADDPATSEEPDYDPNPEPEPKKKEQYIPED